MTKPETIKKLEEKYHVHIDMDTFCDGFNPNTTHESFKIYSGDGCMWDNVIGYRSLVRTLANDKDILKTF